MAGIGFELKKLFARRGLLMSIRAYGYAGIICAGPMLLGVSLLLSIRLMALGEGMPLGDLTLLVSLLTYSLLLSLVLTSLIIMVATRYVADMLYVGDMGKVLPSLYGALTVLLIPGSLAFAVFLSFAGVSWRYQGLCLMLFGVLTVVWTQVGYLTAIKDYKGILLTYAAGALCNLGVSWALLNALEVDGTTALLAGAFFGYGVMMTGFMVLLHRHFPRGEGSPFAFLNWLVRYPALILVGLFVQAGLAGHQVLMWTGSLGERVQGLFYHADGYDIPALLAFFSTIATTVTFVMSVEVNFYPKYRRYFALLNGGADMQDVDQAEKEMFMVLKREMYYLALRQFIVTLVLVVGGGAMLGALGLQLTQAMLRTFRILCVGYGTYAVANSILLVQLYFADNRGALFTAAVFFVTATAATALSLFLDPRLYGFGFLLGSAAMYLAGNLRLQQFCGRLQYYVLCRQPFLAEDYKGLGHKGPRGMKGRRSHG